LAVRVKVRRIGRPPATSEASSACCTKITRPRAVPGRTGTGSTVIVGSGDGDGPLVEVGAVGDPEVAVGEDVGVSVGSVAEPPVQAASAKALMKIGIR